MTSAVPCDIDEADERLALSGADPTEAVILNLRSPVVSDGLMVEPLGVKRLDVCTLEVTSPLIIDSHRVEGKGDRIQSFDRCRGERTSVRSPA